MPEFIVGMKGFFLINGKLVPERTRITTNSETRGIAANDAVTEYNKTHMIPSYAVEFVMTREELEAKDKEEEADRQAREAEKKKHALERKVHAKKLKAHI